MGVLGARSGKAGPPLYAPRGGLRASGLPDLGGPVRQSRPTHLRARRSPCRNLGTPALLDLSWFPNFPSGSAARAPGTTLPTHTCLAHAGVETAEECRNPGA
jgi:hypothetical protein